MLPFPPGEWRITRCLKINYLRGETLQKIVFESAGRYFLVSAVIYGRESCGRAEGGHLSWGLITTSMRRFKARFWLESLRKRGRNCP